MVNVVMVALGGAIGSVARYGVNSASMRIFGSEFPWHTLLVNATGSFAMGLIAQLAMSRLDLPESARLFLMTGLLGGFTTFSAFALDYVQLVESKGHGIAVMYVMASVVLSLAAVFAGLALARSVAA
jgi:fluoride exporter